MYEILTGVASLLVLIGVFSLITSVGEAFHEVF